LVVQLVDEMVVQRDVQMAGQWAGNLSVFESKNILYLKRKVVAKIVQLSK
jgi:hypothetical protein